LLCKMSSMSVPPTKTRMPCAWHIGVWPVRAKILDCPPPTVPAGAVAAGSRFVSWNASLIVESVDLTAAALGQS
jgi:hypothetical protein